LVLRNYRATRSSGKFFAQILQGAPFDILLSADQKVPLRLGQAHVTVPESRFTYARGRLVLWSRISGKNINANSLIATLPHLATANPRLAPYGLAAKQVLEKMSLWDSRAIKYACGFWREMPV